MRASCLTLLLATACNARGLAELTHPPDEQLLPGPRGEDQSLERTIRMEEHDRRLNVCSAQKRHGPHAQSCS